MTDRFLNNGGTRNANVTDGSIDIYGSTIGAENLEASRPIKTNSINQLVSSYLEISDINNLQSTLNSTLTNPYNGTLSATNINSNSFNDITNTTKINMDEKTGVNIVSTSGITSSKFVKSGGTNIQYLMGDGSTLTQSANSGNSNFYLYRSLDYNSGVLPPLTGNISYNNITQSSSTIVYINHTTRDGIDIDVFLSQINQINDLYIQDQSDSTNYIKYNITATPTIFTNSYISIPVVMSNYGGNGNTSFGSTHQVLISFFTNNLEIDTRLSSIETKSQNQSAISGTTTFTGKIVGTKLQSNTLILSNTEIRNCLLTNSEMSSITGSGDTLYGSECGLSLTSGSSNTFYGYQAGKNVTTANFNIGIGQQSLSNCSSNYNIAVGSSLIALTTGEYNVVLGNSSLNGNILGSYNTVIGNNSLINNTGTNNIAIGYQAGNSVAQYTNIISIGNNSLPNASNQVILGNTSITEVKSSGVFNSSIGFKTTTGTTNDILLANGTLNSSLLEIINWRYQSWGYVGSTPVVITIDAVSFMTHIGGSIAVGIISTGSSKTLKYRVQSAPATITNGAVSGWLGTTNTPSLYVKSGYKIIIGFCINDTTTNAATRSMVGLFQSTTAPVLSSTVTVASLTTQSIGIIQEVGENVWSFNTRGSTSSTKVATTISCQTPSNNWLQLEIINLVNSNNIIMTLKDLETGTSATQTFTCGTTSTMSIDNQNYVQIQRNMSAAVPVTGTALIQTAVVKIWSSS